MTSKALKRTVTTVQEEPERQAARWLIEQDDPSFSARDRASFILWLSASVQNRDTYLALERVWHRTLILRKRLCLCRRTLNS